MNKQLNAQVTAEFIGTFMLVFIGAGAVIRSPESIGVLGAALAHGLILTAIVATFGHISGAHVNPAVTVAAWIGRQIPTQKAAYYIVAQLLGGFLAALVLGVVITDSGTLAQTVPASGVQDGQAFVIEAILTFILVSVVYQAAIYEKGGAATPVIIGLTLAACFLMGGSLTGASLNPVRTLAPGLLAGIFDGETQNILDLVIYVVAALFGGALAGFLHIDTFKAESPSDDPKKKGKK